jgi:hypothetical protein
MTDTIDHGDPWPNYYRGYRLHTNADGEVWWQVYDGTDRLYLDPTPTDLVDRLLELKYLGGRVRVTEAGDVLTRVEEGDDFETYYLGGTDLGGDLVPREAPEYSVPVHPTDVSSGELWPSVYDGAKFSFAPGVERVWFADGESHRRCPVETNLPDAVRRELQRFKPKGGSFRVTPWKDVLTLVDVDRVPDAELAAFDDLPRVVKNVLRLRNERGVEKLPVYVGWVEETPLEVGEPESLVDPVDAADLGLDRWVESLGEQTETDPDEHRLTPADDPEDW